MERDRVKDPLLCFSGLRRCGGCNHQERRVPQSPAQPRTPVTPPVRVSATARDDRDAFTFSEHDFEYFDRPSSENEDSAPSTPPPRTPQMEAPHDYHLHYRLSRRVSTPGALTAPRWVHHRIRRPPHLPLPAQCSSAPPSLSATRLLWWYRGHHPLDALPPISLRVRCNP